jgi:hypothetical protein
VPERGARACATVSALPDTRVEDGIGDIDRQVDDDEGRGDEEARALDQRIVPRQDALHEKPAEPGDREQLLDHGGAGHDHAEPRPDDGDDRHQRAAQGVPQHHPQVRRALGARGAHEVAVHPVEHFGTGDPREQPHLHGARHQGRQRHRADPAAGAFRGVDVSPAGSQPG